MPDSRLNLDYLLAIAKDDYTFLQKTFESMLLQTTQLIPEIKNAAVTDKLAELSASLHKFKPGFKIIGAEFLEQTISELEETIKSGKGDIKLLSGKLMADLEALLPELSLIKDKYANLAKSSAG